MKSIEEVLAAMKKLAESNTNLNSETTPTSTSTTYDCPDCKDKGLIFITNDTVRFCHCRIRRKREKLFRDSGISGDFQQLTFKGFDRNRPEPIVDMLRAAVKYRREFQNLKENRKNSILLMGSPGSGKTHLLAAISNELIADELQEVVYFPYAEGFDALRSDLDNADEKIRAMKECDVLFLDDLYKTRRGDPPTKYQLDVIYSVVNARYMNHRPLLVSTELSATELLKIDEATGSRIIEMSKDYRVHIEGDPMLMNWRLIE